MNKKYINRKKYGHNTPNIEYVPGYIFLDDQIQTPFALLFFLLKQIRFDM